MSKDIKKCVLCGMCKGACPVLKILLEETQGPRGRAILIKNNFLEKEAIYNCTLCKACEFSCPAKINLSEIIIKAREELVKKGNETKANKKMIENIRKYGNPYGKIKKGEIPKELYCC